MIETGEVKPKIIHLAKKWHAGRLQLLALVLLGKNYEWIQAPLEDFVKTDLRAHSIEEAIVLARKTWKEEGFFLVNCGYRYTLPERDEHGLEALFHQMAKSLASMTGVYQDEELGHLCLVQNVSLEARHLLDEFKVKKLI